MEVQKTARKAGQNKTGKEGKDTLYMYDELHRDI